MISAKVNIDENNLEELINKKVQEVVKDIYPYPPLMNKEQAIKFSGFGKQRMDAVFYLYKNLLDEDNGGCVLYAGQGQSYVIKRKGFEQFLEKHVRDIRNIDLDEYYKDKVLYKVNMWG